MPSLLSRFFGKKKSAEPSDLLGGEKFEAVEQPSSPSAQAFTVERPQSPAKEGKGFGIRRKPVPSPTGKQKRDESAPTLSLTLSDTKLEEKKSQGLGIAFEDITNAPLLLNKDALISRMLTPAEALCLIQKTADSISERGVETLGVMRPHWFASLPHQEIQQKLINRYIQALSDQQTNGATSTSTTSPLVALEYELRYTRDQHDVAAVLRWGLRHLELQGNRLGITEDWYKSFTEAEQAASYPPKAFDEILTPLLPDIHTQLIRVLLDLVSSLAAHSEQNSISGNKLSKVLAWWIVSSRNTAGLEWSSFYKQWEIAARQFEHMFLAFIRAQEVQSRMPRRLTELVQYYPFSKNRREDDGILLPRSRFSTRKMPALFLRISVNKEGGTAHPLHIVEEAFKATADGPIDGDLVTLWQNIRGTAYSLVKDAEVRAEMSLSQSQSSLNLSLVLADESIRLFSLVPTPRDSGIPTVSLFPSLSANKPRRSFSNAERPQSIVSATAASEKLAASPATPAGDLDILTDWQAFSTAGFRSPSGLSLAASLWDNDTEVTRPPSPKKNNGVGKRNLSIRSGRTSTDAPSPVIAAGVVSPGLQDAEPTKILYSSPEPIQLDEAFIDFWADTLLDTAVTRSWPTFVVCQLKPVTGLCWPGNESEKHVEWLVIERVVTKTPAPSSPLSEVSEPTPPMQSKKNTTGNKGFKWPLTPSSLKRRSIFNSNSKVSSEDASTGFSASGKKKASIGLKVDEMGEILKEEEEEIRLKEETRVQGVSKTDDRKPENHIVQVNGNGTSQPKKKKIVPDEPLSPVERNSQEMAAVAAAAGGPEVLAGILEHVEEKGEETKVPVVEVETVSAPAIAPAVEPAVTALNVPTEVAEHTEGGEGAEKAEPTFALAPVPIVEHATAASLEPEVLVGVTEHDEGGGETKIKEAKSSTTSSPTPVLEYSTVQHAKGEGEGEKSTGENPAQLSAPAYPATVVEPEVEEEKEDTTTDEVWTASAPAEHGESKGGEASPQEDKLARPASAVESTTVKYAEGGGETELVPAIAPALAVEPDGEGGETKIKADEPTFVLTHVPTVEPTGATIARPEVHAEDERGETRAEETESASVHAPTVESSGAVADVLDEASEPEEAEEGDAMVDEAGIAEGQAHEETESAGEPAEPDVGIVDHNEDETETKAEEAEPAVEPTAENDHDGEGLEAEEPEPDAASRQETQL